MAVDAVSLVKSDLEVVFELDTTLEGRIAERVEATMALKGWILSDVDDQKAVYLAALTTQAFIPRLLLKFAQEIKKAKGGKAETEFMNAIDYLKALQAQVEATLQDYAANANPEDVSQADPVLLEALRWTSSGPVSW
jgi:hypothetical protein